MIKKYFMSAGGSFSGSNLIHAHGCPFLPLPGRKIFLGTFSSPAGAMEEAKKFRDNPKICRFCLKEHYHEPEYQVPAEMGIMPHSEDTANHGNAPLNIIFTGLN